MTRSLYWLLTVSLCVLSLAACGDDDDDAAGDGDADADGAPAAPSGLDGTPMGDGLHLTWTDNSDDEEEFVVERADEGTDAFEEVTREPADTTEYHDAPLNAGTYDYRVSASNASGQSAWATGTFEMN